MTHPKRLLYWTAPSLLCLLLYWNGLRAWFQMDDFAWLGLYQRVHDWPSFLEAMFRPLAQGTVRPWSERAFFMAFAWWFGMVALPFRIVVFATQILNLVLLTTLTRRLTGSAAAGLLAPMLWLVNISLYLPMAWTSAYNQVLCSTFLLGAFLLFHRFTETGDRRYYTWQWIIFLLGFGANELNVVFPALAALYAASCARRYLASTLPLFGVSAVYAVVHRIAAPKPETSIYRMYFDADLPYTLFTYLRWTLGADGFARQKNWNWQLFAALELLVGAALLGFLIYKLRQRQWVALFFAGWYLIVLAPLLPLKNHFTEYYAMMPTLGLSMLGAWGLAAAMERGAGAKVAAAVLALMYAAPSGFASWSYTRNTYINARDAKGFLTRVAYAHKLHPDRTILVKGLTSQLFWSGFYGNPFRIFGLSSIYMTPDTEAHIEPFPEMGPISQHFLAESVALDGIRKGRVVVYEMNDGQLRRITPVYERALAAREELSEPKHLEAGLPIFDGQLGTGWHQAEDGHRWTSRRATLRMSGPFQVVGRHDGAEELRVRGVAVPEQVRDAPLFLTVSVGGRPYPPSRIDSSNLDFQFRYPLAQAFVGQRSIEIAVEVDRTLRKLPDERELGVAFGTFQVVP